MYAPLIASLRVTVVKYKKPLLCPIAVQAMKGLLRVS